MVLNGALAGLWCPSRLVRLTRPCWCALGFGAVGGADPWSRKCPSLTSSRSDDVGRCHSRFHPDGGFLGHFGVRLPPKGHPFDTDSSALTLSVLCLHRVAADRLGMILKANHRHPRERRSRDRWAFDVFRTRALEAISRFSEKLRPKSTAGRQCAGFRARVFLWVAGCVLTRCAL